MANQVSMQDTNKKTYMAIYIIVNSLHCKNMFDICT